MLQVDVVVIGGGYAGLAMSHCLTEHGISHLIFERGKLAERWRSERWDSLRLLTPNWHTRLPGWCYAGNDPHGYMKVSEFIQFLEDYANSFAAPIKTQTLVEMVKRTDSCFTIETNDEIYQANVVVIATGHCDQPFVPSLAKNLDPNVTQWVAPEYRNPKQLPAGGVLVVGASASGTQIAEELVNAGRDVCLSVGRHRRFPRRYRGRDILWWVDQMGVFAEPADPSTSRGFPAPQLVGSVEGRSLDLGILQDKGVCLTGRIKHINQSIVEFENNLQDSIEQAEQEMRAFLKRIDDYAADNQLGGEAIIPDEIAVKEPQSQINVSIEGITNIIWATGYRRRYPWLGVDVLNDEGELRHSQGITEEPGLYVLGLRRQRRNNSNFIDGVGADAMFLSEHLVDYLASI